MTKPLENPKWEKFAQDIANGSTGIQAYRTNVAEPGSKTNTCMVQASILLSNPNVSERVDYLRKLANETLERKLGWNKEKALRYLVEVLETPVGEVDQDHRLAQEIGFDSDGQMKVKLPGKGDALKQLAVMCGWNEAGKVEVTHSGTIEHTHSFDGVIKSIIDSGSPVTRRLEKAREREVELIPLEPQKKKK